MDEKTVRHMVRRVVYRTLGMPQGSQPMPGRPLITEAEVRDLPPGGQLDLPPGALITPLARQIALEKGVSLARAGTTPAPEEATSPSPGPAGAKTVAIGTDHGGYQLKEMLKGYLGELGYSVVDCGTNSASSVDYPDFAFAVAQLVAHRLQTERLVRRVAEARLPTAFGDFRIIAYSNEVDQAEHVALVRGDVQGGENVLVRMHSKCLTGDVFRSERCDCGTQLREAMRSSCSRPLFWVASFCSRASTCASFI